MPGKFKNKYRGISHRKPGWDYSSDGMYFITLVTQNRVCNLGEIIDAAGSAYVQLSDFGQIVDAEWKKSFEIRNELFMDEYIIMPNHLHAIVVIDKNNKTTMVDTVDGDAADTVDGDAADTVDGVASDTVDGVASDTVDGVASDTVGAHGRAPLRYPPHTQWQPPIQLQPFFRLPKSISSFFAGFKSAVNSTIDDYIDANNLNIRKYNRNNHFFQPNYHDHIIRDEQSYQRISEYIKNNPAKWQDDKFFNNEII